MDFQYLFTVLARRWRVLIALGAVGVILGAMLYATYPETYEARAVLEILPPRSASGIGSWNADPDRYVIGQVAVLDNISLAANVASKVHGLSTQDVVTSRTIVRPTAHRHPDVAAHDRDEGADGTGRSRPGDAAARAGQR